MSAETSARPAQAVGSDFARLSRMIAETGLMARRPGYYTLRFVAVAVLYAGGWTAFALVGSSWWTLAVAAVLAVVYAQIALVADDVAHRQVFRLRRASEMTRADRRKPPDRQLRLRLVAGQAHPPPRQPQSRRTSTPTWRPTCWVWSHGPGRGRAPRACARVHRTAHQACCTSRCSPLEGVNLHVAGRPARCSGPTAHKQRAAGGHAAQVAHIAVYAAALLFLVLPPGRRSPSSPSTRPVRLSTWAALRAQPQGHADPGRRRGPRTSCAARCSPPATSAAIRSTDLALGGLNHQIEHHLFPSMPSPHLRRAQLLVRRYCEELGLAYLETGLITSYRQALASLHRAEAPLRGTHTAS